MKKVLTLLVVMCLVSFVKPVMACTNFLITPGASVDGSSMISYAADSHVLYGELYHFPAADYPEGAMRQIVDWDSGRYLGSIPEDRDQAAVEAEGRKRCGFEFGRFIIACERMFHDIS